MTHYPDLSPYTYGSTSRTRLNVGWLDREHPFAVGLAPAGLISALVRHAREPINVQRGMHFCNLCPSFHVARKNTTREDLFIGSGEILVAGCEGKMYVSPLMIIHYVEAHGYLPPEEFCIAVCDGRSGLVRDAGKA
ncbi:hypothetical protein [Streptomyces sp. JHA26]|uniref:DUF7919 family protein n=1 Tax=Streptomyces sp. JHA26 TaxID=1917143 RepID=UPI00117E85F0|nr:hypothetical protein [Streptomyces sp. JHA26]